MLRSSTAANEGAVRDVIYYVRTDAFDAWSKEAKALGFRPQAYGDVLGLHIDLKLSEIVARKEQFQALARKLGGSAGNWEAQILASENKGAR